jgi:multiple sugar transport system substrate-binding protein
MRFGNSVVMAMLVALLCSTITLAATPVEITIGYYESTAGLGQYSITMEQLIQEFMEANPHITVKSTFTGYKAFFDRLPVELAAGTGPDVWLCDGVLVDQYAAQGFALDLSDYVAALPNPENYFGIENNRSPDGRLWAFPQGIQSSALFYNKEQFDKAGVAYPTDKWTLDDLRANAKKLTVDANNDGVPEVYGYRSFNHITEGWSSIIRSFGGGMLDAQRRNSKFNDPNTVAALQYMVDMILVDRVSPPATTSGPFNWFPNQLVSMQTGLYVRTDGANKAGFEYDVTAVPSGPAGRFNPVIINSWVINSRSSKAKQDAAWAWIEFFSSERAQQVWAELGEAVPVNRRVALSVFMQLRVPPANRMAFVTGMDHAMTLDPNPVWSDWQAAATSALTPAFRGQQSVAEAALKAHEAVQVILDEFYKR